ncbi:MAG: VOC family protein [candidate division Zixibacteria bacterium]|nr:VOC family protein [candidate division Zixibacteria bacterium]
MNGIVFFKTRDLARLRTFYLERIGATIWLDQGDCHIFRHGNFLFGFCDRDDVDTCGMLTFYYESQDQVDVVYTQLRDIATTEPVLNEKYNIYQFFAADPDGRTLEFQFFNHPLPELT